MKKINSQLLKEALEDSSLMIKAVVVEPNLFVLRAYDKSNPDSEVVEILRAECPNWHIAQVYVAAYNLGQLDDEMIQHLEDRIICGNCNSRTPWTPCAYPDRCKIGRNEQAAKAGIQTSWNYPLPKESSIVQQITLPPFKYNQRIHMGQLTKWFAFKCRVKNLLTRIFICWRWGHRPHTGFYYADGTMLSVCSDCMAVVKRFKSNELAYIVIRVPEPAMNEPSGLDCHD